MEILSNLLRVRVWKNSILYKKYGFSEDEVKLVKVLTNAFLKGQTSMAVTDLAYSVYKLTKERDILKIIPNLIQLRKKGYIDFGNSSFLFDTIQRLENDNPPYLEILHTNVYLTTKFLFLLQGVEEESLNIDTSTPYQSIFEYINDKLKKVQIWQISDNLDSAVKKSKKLDKDIGKKLSISNINPPLKKILEKAKFSEKEEVIFLAVLSEELSHKNGRNYHNPNNLIDLISFNNHERLENNLLLREDSPIFQNGYLKFDSSIHIITDDRTFSNSEIIIPDDILEEIEGHKTTKSKKKGLDILKSLIEEQEIFELVEPKKDLDEVVLPKETKKILETIIKQLDKKVIDRLVEWGIKETDSIDARILFHGVAGTGKTLTALALAKSLGKVVLHFDSSKILSMYVGESEKNVRNIFDTYKKIVQESGISPVLLLNEADQFLTTRSTDTNSSVSQMYNQMQNIFLEQIEKFEGVLIATTNLLENIDKAFSRRFNYKVKFKPPTREERIELWKIHLPKNAKFAKNFSVEKLADYKLTGGQIDLIVKNTAFKVATKPKAIFTLEDFIREIEREKSSNFENDNIMGFLK